MCPSSWKSYLDDFPFFGSALAHLEPKLELFGVWELMPSTMMMIYRTFISHVCNLFCLQNFLTTRPDPSRYPNFFASTRPVPSRSQKPLPVGPCWRKTEHKLEHQQKAVSNFLLSWIYPNDQSTNFYCFFQMTMARAHARKYCAHSQAKGPLS